MEENKMAENKASENKNQFVSTIEALFQGIDQFVTTKTVVGDAVKVDNAIILPLVDVTCGMAAGAFQENAKKRGSGGMGAKISPSAILVIQNGSTRLVNIKDQNTVNKMLDMVPDLVNRFTKGKVNIGEEFSADAIRTAEDMAVDAARHQD
jgi:uncharacterized spore protein YtfJ